MNLPRPLSHSSMSMYTECPQKYKFKYIDRIPERPRHFFSFGSSVHTALEFFYGAKTLPAPTLEAVLAYFAEHWLSQGYKDKDQELEYLEEGQRILSRFYAKHIADFSLPFFVEYNFDLKVEGIPVTGKVDRIDKLADGTLSILDYKTGKALASGRALTDAQLTMYQMAAEELLGITVSRLSFYHLPSLKEQVSEPRQKEQVAELKKKIVRTAEGITSEKFEAKPDENKCRWCDYKPLCPIFKHQFTTAQQNAMLASATLATTNGIALPPSSPAPVADEELSALIDRYGELLKNLSALKGEIIARLEKKGYARAFGHSYEAVRAVSSQWEFSDKPRLLELIRKAGLYEGVLAPSAAKIAALLEDKNLDADLRARLTELAVKIEKPEIKISPV